MLYSKSSRGFYDAAVHGDNIPSDAVAVSNELYASLLEGQSQGKTISAGGDGYPYLADQPAPTQAQIIGQYESALDTHLDSVAQAHRYKDRFSFALRAGYAGPFHAEGAAFAGWMDACNVQAYQLLTSVLEGGAELPSIDGFIASLPPFSMPE